MCFRLLGDYVSYDYWWFFRDITMGLPWIHTWQMLSSRNRELHWNELVVAVCDDVGSLPSTKCLTHHKLEASCLALYSGTAVHITYHDHVYEYIMYMIWTHTHTVYIYIYTHMIPLARGYLIVENLSCSSSGFPHSPTSCSHKSPGEVRHFSIFFRYPSPASHQQKVQDPSFFPGSIWLAAGSFPDTRWIWDPGTGHKTCGYEGWHLVD